MVFTCPEAAPCNMNANIWHMFCVNALAQHLLDINDSYVVCEEAEFRPIERRIIQYRLCSQRSRRDMSLLLVKRSNFFSKLREM